MTDILTSTFTDFIKCFDGAYSQLSSGVKSPLKIVNAKMIAFTMNRRTWPILI